MKYKLVLVLCLILFSSHDMYLKMDTFFIEPNEDAIIHLYNGTFDKSENTIDRDRMLDVSLVGNGERTKLQNDQWTEKDSITILNFKSGDAGTWVAGVSTAPRNIEMAADDFNNYLKHDGVKDMLTSREKNGTLDQDAVEKYSKHVKAIFQLGDTRSEDWGTVLGYPIEFIPLNNPYETHTGGTLKVKLLSGGEPLANQLVYANYKSAIDGHSHDGSDSDHSHDDSGEDHSHEAKEHTHDGTTHSHETETEPHDHDAVAATESHEHTEGAELRTDENGVIEVNLTSDGIWYLRTIHMVSKDEEELTHESNWATLTFEVTHDHKEDHGDDHTHADEDGIPSYVFWIGSIVVLAGLFFYFNQKK